MSAATGKKGKKKSKNTKTLSLNDFLGDTASPGQIKPLDWADETEESSYSSSLAYQTSSSRREQKPIQLPTAPRAARNVEVDTSRIPDHGPYTAFVGNLPFEVNKEVLEDFFKDLAIDNIRLPEENGRFKGFGYIQFSDRNSLIEALKLNDSQLHKRTIRVDIGNNQNKDSGGGRYGSGGFSQREGPDPTEGNWRKAAAEEGPSYNDRGSDRYGGGRQSRGGGFDQYDRSEGTRSRDGGGAWGRDRRDDYGSGGGSRNDRYGGDRYGGDRGGNDRYGSSGRSDRYGGDRYGGGSDRNDRYGGDRYGDRNDRYGGDRSYGGDRNDRYGGSDRYGDRREGGRFTGRMEPRSDDRYGSRGGSASEEPRQRPTLKLQPRQKPIETEGNAAPRASSIFGDAKPVDTTARELEVEKKEVERKRISSTETERKKSSSSSIFGDAKPVDTYSREQEIERKISSTSVSDKPKEQPAPTKKQSIFGSAKPVNTFSREQEMEAKIAAKRKEVSGSMRERRLSSRSSDDGHNDDRSSRRQQRRSRDHADGSESGAPSERRLSSDSSAPQKSSAQEEDAPVAETKEQVEYKPAPAPVVSAWSKKLTIAEAAEEAAEAEAQNHVEASSKPAETHPKQQDATRSDERQRTAPRSDYQSDRKAGYGDRRGKDRDQRSDKPNGHAFRGGLELRAKKDDKPKDKPTDKNDNYKPVIKKDTAPVEFVQKSKFALLSVEDDEEDDSAAASGGEEIQS